jgi:hypothetical protein
MLYLAFDVGLHYLTFVRRNLEDKKTLTLIWLMNSAGLNSKIIVNSVGIFNDNPYIR